MFAHFGVRFSCLWRSAIHDSAKLMPGLQDPEFVWKNG